ncbi:hypothetical protein CDAR_93341 [Caerostris darwini]|uniref:Uncharacterized protein n=1 Tax=Caerostris darwini TaxID=1538125 RepID=A0AAV4QFN4_9ARAC|nr:hypothetical protein CDAR_93341 [Caerostris darwini]
MHSKSRHVSNNAARAIQTAETWGKREKEKKRKNGVLQCEGTHFPFIKSPIPGVPRPGVINVPLTILRNHLPALQRLAVFKDHLFSPATHPS